jgi:hypothetical protein
MKFDFWFCFAGALYVANLMMMVWLAVHAAHP